MKKIQVSTTTALVKAEVVVLNSYTVAKAIKAAIGVEQFKSISEALGNPRFEKVLDDDGEPVTHYTVHKDQLDLLIDYVFPFVEEFAQALENKEEVKQD